MRTIHGRFGYIVTWYRYIATFGIGWQRTVTRHRVACRCSGIKDHRRHRNNMLAAKRHMWRGLLARPNGRLRHVA